MNQIQQTSNYDKFRDIRGNREINRKFLTKLVVSIGDDNMLDLNPIIVNEKMQVLDGQHRLLACKKLGIPVSYIVAKNGGIRQVRMFNSNARIWGMKNYLASYVDLGEPEYLKVQTFIDKTGLSLGVSLMLLNGNRSRTKNEDSLIKRFKEGDFKADQEEYAYDFYKKLIAISKYCESDSVWKDRDFVTALGLVYKSGISHKELMEKLERSQRIPGLKLRRQYIRLLEDILSYHRKSPVRLV